MVADGGGVVLGEEFLAAQDGSGVGVDVVGRDGPGGDRFGEVLLDQGGRGGDDLEQRRPRSRPRARAVAVLGDAGVVHVASQQQRAASTLDQAQQPVHDDRVLLDVGEVEVAEPLDLSLRGLEQRRPGHQDRDGAGLLQHVRDPLVVGVDLAVEHRAHVREGAFAERAVVEHEEAQRADLEGVAVGVRVLRVSSVLERVVGGAGGLGPVVVDPGDERRQPRDPADRVVVPVLVVVGDRGDRCGAQDVGVAGRHSSDRHLPVLAVLFLELPRVSVGLDGRENGLEPRVVQVHLVPDRQDQVGAVGAASESLDGSAGLPGGVVALEEAGDQQYLEAGAEVGGHGPGAVARRVCWSVRCGSPSRWRTRGSCRKCVRQPRQLGWRGRSVQGHPLGSRSAVPGRRRHCGLGVGGSPRISASPWTVSASTSMVSPAAVSIVQVRWSGRSRSKTPTHIR